MDQTYSDVPDEHLMGIGLITVNFSQLEIFVEMGIWKLLGYEKNQDIGKIITSELGFRNKVGLLSALHIYLCNDENDKSALKKLIKRINTAREIRNDFAHSLIGIGEQGKIVRFEFRAGVKKGLVEGRESFSAEQIITKAKLIEKVSIDFMKFITNNNFPNTDNQ